MSRRLVSSGGPWEASAAYSRAVAVGDTCWVAGTTDAGPDGRSLHPGDIGAQTKAVLAIIEAALAEAGFALGDIVRIRMFVTDISRSAEVMAVQGSSSPRSGRPPHWSKSVRCSSQASSSKSRRTPSGAGDRQSGRSRQPERTPSGRSRSRGRRGPTPPRPTRRD